MPSISPEHRKFIDALSRMVSVYETAMPDSQFIIDLKTICLDTDLNGVTAWRAVHLGVFKQLPFRWFAPKILKRLIADLHQVLFKAHPLYVLEGGDHDFECYLKRRMPELEGEHRLLREQVDALEAQMGECHKPRVLFAKNTALDEQNRFLHGRAEVVEEENTALQKIVDNLKLENAALSDELASVPDLRLRFERLESENAELRQLVHSKDLIIQQQGIELERQGRELSHLKREFAGTCAKAREAIALAEKFEAAHDALQEEMTHFRVDVAERIDVLEGRHDAANAICLRTFGASDVQVA